MFGRPNMSCLDSLRTDMLCRYVIKTYSSKRRYKRSLVCVDVAGRDNCLHLSFKIFKKKKKKKKKKTEVANTKTNNFYRVKSTSFIGDFWKPDSFCSSVATLGEEMFLLVGESNTKLANHVAFCVIGSEMNYLPSLT